MNHHAPDLAPLFSPRSMAIVGASRHKEKLGHALLAHVLASGFSGSIHVINPHGGEILGQKVLPTLTACPRGVELVVLALPALLIIEQARVAIGRGCAALVVMSNGFGESDAAGAQREITLARLCQERGVLLLGPNSLGLMHRQHGLNASLTSVIPPAGGISLISQSGAVCAATLEWMASRQLGLAKMICLGNEAGITDAQCLTHLAHDPETRVIACYLEWVSDGKEFLKAATEAAHQKPVILLLGGSSAWYQRPALQRAGCRIHSPAILSAICDRMGVIQSHGFQDWLDTMMALTRSSLPNNNRVAIISNGGGPGMLAFDMLDQHELVPVGLSHTLISSQQPRLPVTHALIAPVDLGWSAQPEHLRTTVEAVAGDDASDAMLVVLTPLPNIPATEMVHALLAAGNDHKPLLAVLMGGDAMRAGQAKLDHAGVASYPTPERAAVALAALDRYSRWRRRAPRVVTTFAVNPGRVGRLIHRCHALGIQRLTDLESKQILHAYGIVIPEGEQATTLDKSMEIAERLGYPVALHLLSPELHLVKDLEVRHDQVSGPQAMRDAFDLLTLRFAKQWPEGRLDGVFVEKIIAHGRPILMGMQHDGQFGPLLHVGSANPLALSDTYCQLAPITTTEAVNLLHSGCRHNGINELGELDESEVLIVAEVLQRLGQLANDFPQIDRITINPLIIRRSGLLPVATECDIHLRPDEPPS